MHYSNLESNALCNQTADELEDAHIKFLASQDTSGEEHSNWEHPTPEKEQVLNNSHFMYARNNILTGPLIQAIYSENQPKFDAYITILCAGSTLTYNELWRDFSGCEGVVDTTSVSEIKAYFFDEYVIEALEESVFNKLIISPQAESFLIPFTPYTSFVDYIAINIGIVLYYH